MPDILHIYANNHEAAYACSEAARGADVVHHDVPRRRLNMRDGSSHLYRSQHLDPACMNGFSGRVEIHCELMKSNRDAWLARQEINARCFDA